jgi:hypothetical protein
MAAFPVGGGVGGGPGPAAAGAGGAGGVPFGGGFGGGGFGGGGFGGGFGGAPVPGLGYPPPGPIHGAIIFAMIRLLVGRGVVYTLRFLSAASAARAFDLFCIATKPAGTFTPNSNPQTFAFLCDVVRRAFPRQPAGTVQPERVIAALRRPGSNTRNAATWADSAARAAVAFAPGAAGLGVVERDAGVSSVLHARINFYGTRHTLAAPNLTVASRVFDLLNIMRGPVVPRGALRTPNHVPATTAFFRAVVDLYFAGVNWEEDGIPWEAARAAVVDPASPVHAAAYWTPRGAALATASAALLAESPAGWLNAFGMLWEWTAQVVSG